MNWKKFFIGALPKVIGMIHVPALPGTPKNSYKFSEIIDKVKEEAMVYKRAAIDAVLVENMHDVPYIHPSRMGPETTACMTHLAHEVRQIVPRNIPCGVQVLAAANKEALAVALSANLQFIRCEGFVFGHVADEGYTDACAGELIRYRKNIGAAHILIFTDIKKKHSAHLITSDISIGYTAEAAEFFLSDGLVVTGMCTGGAANVADLKEVRSHSKLPVLVGSGVTLGNLHQYSSLVEGIIIGSYFKETGRWDGRLDEKKIINFMEEINKMRNGHS